MSYDLEQGWPTSSTRGPHNSLRIRLRAAHVYTYIARRGGEIELDRGRYLQAIRYAQSTAKCQDSKPFPTRPKTWND